MGMPVVHRSVSGRYVPRTTIWDSKPSVNSSKLRMLVGSSPRFGLPPPPPVPRSNCSTSRWHGSTEEPSTGVQGGIPPVGLGGTGVGVGTEVGVGPGAGTIDSLPVEVASGVGVSVGSGVGAGVAVGFSGAGIGSGVCVEVGVRRADGTRVGSGVGEGCGIDVGRGVGTGMGSCVGVGLGMGSGIGSDVGGTVGLDVGGTVISPVQAAARTRKISNVNRTPLITSGFLISIIYYSVPTV